jgi:hypothetical protein
MVSNAMIAAHVLHAGHIIIINVVAINEKTTNRRGREKKKMSSFVCHIMRQILRKFIVASADQDHALIQIQDPSDTSLLLDYIRVSKMDEWGRLIVYTRLHYIYLP